MIILVIEDDINISSLFVERMIFYKLRYKVANNGVEAYKILYETKPESEFDFVITNIGLPDENGVEIIKFIKEKFNSKIIVYSGKKHFRDKFNCECFFYDKKDKSPEEIIDMIVNNNLQ